MRATLGPDGLMRFCGQIFRARFGHGGISGHKREGDGATPAGLLPLRRVLYRADRLGRPLARVPVEPLAPNDGWCDESGHADYNRLITLPHPARHESLWRDDGIYDVVGVLGWNDSPVEKGRGSAIFLHVARADGRPTEGCVALAMSDLLAVLSGLTEIAVSS
jgi:L,D-peptidoglycan transpeptidase YkuD (ErfK/YbiS/YcfS/YnhG family)